MEFTEPGFRDSVKEGHEVVVGGKAFGCGSSRQEAVQSLLGETMLNMFLSFVDFQMCSLADFMCLLSRCWCQVCNRQELRVHLRP